MNKNWASCKIMDLTAKGEAELKTGPFGTQLHASDYVETGTPVINVRNIGFGNIREDNLEFISEETVQRLRSHLLEAEDIVFGRKGAVERHAFIEQKHIRWFQGSDCLRLRIKTARIVPRFLSYYFQTEAHKQWMIMQCSHGSTMASLNQDIISRISFPLPPLLTQHKIASILSAYDDLIQNNTRRIAILEEMAQTIYQEWFVHFHYPGHEKNKMVESELGMIPEGWEVAKFTEIADVLSGGTPRKSNQDYWDGEIPFFAPRDAKSSFYILETEQHITELGLKACNSKLYPNNTVFITARGTVGKVLLNAVNMAMNQSCYALQGKGGVTQYFIFMTIKNCVDQLKKQATGAVFETIIVDTFRLLDVLKPPTNLMEKFSHIVHPIFKQILNLLKRKNILISSRDLLLPKLISGEIDVETLNIDIPDIPEPEVQQNMATIVQPEPIDASQLAFLF